MNDDCRTHQNQIRRMVERVLGSMSDALDNAGLRARVTTSEDWEVHSAAARELRIFFESSGDLVDTIEFDMSQSGRIQPLGELEARLPLQIDDVIRRHRG